MNPFTYPAHSCAHAVPYFTLAEYPPCQAHRHTNMIGMLYSVEVLIACDIDSKPYL